MSKVCMYIIRFYQIHISPAFGAHCRFLPTCSEYSYEAFRKYGFFKGLSLSFKRIIRCHPLCKGGYDPVP